jgi:AIPR protein
VLERDELIDRLEGDVARLASEVYSSPGDAFTHVAVREYFDLDDDEALEYCDVGGSHDKGIDAFWLDDAEGRAVLVQAKWSSPDTRKFNASALREAEAAYRWLTRLSEGRDGKAAPRVVDAAHRLAGLRDVEPDYPIHVFVIVAGSFTRGAQEELGRISHDLRRDPAEFHLVALDQLLEQMEERASRAGETDEVEPEVTFQLQEEGYFEYLDDPQALVATIDGGELAAAAVEWSYHLFMRNVRFFLSGEGRRGSVNQGIRQTLDNREGRQRFWYYNNGIAVVCDSYDLDRENHTVTVNNMQIVNGAQTTTTLKNALEALKQTPRANLLARIIAAPDEELQQRITLYNNRQNAVKDRDLMSNDPVQDRLHREFLRRDPPWFYERKGGEWQALTEQDAQLKTRIQKRRIDNQRAAQAAYAFYFDPAVARADKKHLFQPRTDGGYYEDIFNAGTSTAWMLVPYLLADFVAAEKARYLKSIRGLDPRSASVAQRRTLRRQWLKFADQFIVGTIGYYVMSRGGVEDERLEELLAGDFQRMAAGAYHAAIRDLQPLFDRKEREASAEEPFSVANFVKTHWEEAVKHLDAEWDARDAVGDPLEGVPMLSEDDLEEG